MTTPQLDSKITAKNYFNETKNCEKNIDLREKNKIEL